MTKTYQDLKKISHLLLRPALSVSAVEDIQLEFLKDRGITTLLIDIDNTLVGRYQRFVNLAKEIWVERATSQFHVALISNNSSFRRVNRIAKKLNLQGLYFACKPFPYAIGSWLARHNTDRETTAMIGDQLFTDVAVGNWFGMTTILVTPIDHRLSFIKTCQQDFEAWVLNKLQS